jgi:hypothetical protein
MIANLDKNLEHTQVQWIKASIKEDGGFTVTNSRNGFSRTYMTR